MNNIFVSIAVFLLAGNIQATVITDSKNVDRIVTFDGISGSLEGYTEGGLLVSTEGTHCCSPNAHYASGGNNSFVTISTTDGAYMLGLQLDFGSGYGDHYSEFKHNVVWETLKDGNTTGSGVLYNVFGSNSLNKGFSVLSWYDDNLFDTLLVGSAPTITGYDAFGHEQDQAIVIDNVRVDLSGNASTPDTARPVPEPTSLALLSLGLAAVRLSKKMS